MRTYFLAKHLLLKPWSQKPHERNCIFPYYTVKLTRAKLLASAGNFTRGLHVKRPHTQLTCVTCNLPVKTGKFTRVYAASTSRRIHANYLQRHVILLGYSGNFTSNFKCRTKANFPSRGMQNCLLLQEKMHAICRKKYPHQKTINLKELVNGLIDFQK